MLTSCQSEVEASDNNWVKSWRMVIDETGRRRSELPRWTDYNDVDSKVGLAIRIWSVGRRDEDEATD
jgi:hypothetical protein